MEIYEKEALLNLFYTDENRHKSDKTNGELYNEIVEDLRTEWKENKGLYHDDKQHFINEWADSHTEIYTTEIFKWYSQAPQLYYWADEAIGELGYPQDDGIVKALQYGIYHFLGSFAFEILGGENETQN